MPEIILQQRINSAPYINKLRTQELHSQKSIEKKRAELRHPSTVKYLFLGIVSLIGDIVDLAGITGVGIAVTMVVDIFVGIILAIGGIHTRGKLEKFNKETQSLSAYAQLAEKRLLQARKTYMRVIKLSRKVKLLRAPVRKVVLSISKMRRAAKKLVKVTLKSPLFRKAGAIGLDLIPLVELVPWRTISVGLER